MDINEFDLDVGSDRDIYVLVNTEAELNRLLDIDIVDGSVFNEGEVPFVGVCRVGEDDVIYFYRVESERVEFDLDVDGFIEGLSESDIDWSR